LATGRSLEARATIRIIHDLQDKMTDAGDHEHGDLPIPAIYDVFIVYDSMADGNSGTRVVTP
jgi:hypothetical protein